MSGQRTEPVLRTGAPREGVSVPVLFPPDLGSWVGRPGLLQIVEGAAARGCGDSWLNLVADETAGQAGDDLLVLVAYCYLQGIYHSFDVVRRLDLDEVLVELRGRLAVRPEQVRRFRREHRRALTDCLTHALVALWRQRHPMASDPAASDHLIHQRLNFSFLEPFYLQAQDRLDRAVVLDSMALDY